jgi:O-antigen ligase
MEPLFWFIIFLSWYTVHLFFSNHLQFSLVDFRLMYILNITVFFYSLYFSNLKGYVTQIFFFAGLIYVIFSAITFSTIFSSQQTLDNFSNIFSIIGLSGEDAIYQNYGLWLSILAIITTSFIYSYRKSNLILKLFLYITLLFSILGTLLVGARAAFIGVTIGTLYYLIKIRSKSTILVFIGIAFLLLPLFLLNEDLLLTINRILRLFGGTDDSGRVFMFSQALNLWTESWTNIIFGAGVKSYPIFIGVNSSGAYPHNIFLEILCELGIVGLSLFLLVFYSAFKNNSNDPLFTSLTLCLLIIFSFTGGISDLYNIFFFLGLSLTAQE